jgi:nucleotide-binding universal stress UspA family protein
MVTTEHHPPTDSSATERFAIFDRVLVGVDPSAESREAVRQAALLANPRQTLALVAAWTLAPPVVDLGACSVDVDEDAPRVAAEEALRRAGEDVGPARARQRLVRGTAWHVVLDEAVQARASLVVVGSHGQGRVRGALVGSTTTNLVHRAPYSLLVARQAGVGFPQRIVVGVDGSVESAAAYVAARYLADRFDAELHPLVAWGGKGIDERLVAAITGGEHEDRHEAPAHALTDAAERADLVVVGSRGLHGLRALGSVSERVAHTASCSTLVVREPSWQRVAEELGR